MSPRHHPLATSNEGMSARLRLALLEGRYGMLVGLTATLGTAAVLLIGVRHVQEGVLTLGQLLMALSYVLKVAVVDLLIDKDATTEPGSVPILYPTKPAPDKP